MIATRFVILQQPEDMDWLTVGKDIGKYHAPEDFGDAETLCGAPGNGAPVGFYR